MSKKYVFIYDRNGHPLLPSCRTGRIEKLLSDREAVVVRQKPYTVQLTGETRQYRFLWKTKRP